MNIYNEVSMSCKINFQNPRAVILSYQVVNGGALGGYISTTELDLKSHSWRVWVHGPSSVRCENTPRFLHMTTVTRPPSYPQDREEFTPGKPYPNSINIGYNCDFSTVFIGTTYSIKLEDRLNVYRDNHTYDILAIAPLRAECNFSARDVDMAQPGTQQDTISSSGLWDEL